MDALPPPPEPFFFGPPARQLFGCYHPTGGAPGDHVVVLCPPLGHESIQLHRALRQLAVQLARAGLAALRFDYRGCGDSSGESSDVRLPDWRDDVDCAATTARVRSGAARVHLVGLRLGGALALLAAADRTDVDAVALWDPVSRGDRYLGELTALHRQMLWTAHVPLDGDTGGGGIVELLGLPLSARSVADLGALDLHDAASLGRAPQHVLVVTSRDDADAGRLADHLARLGADVTRQHLRNDALWAWAEDLDRLVAPQTIIRAVRTWLVDRAP